MKDIIEIFIEENREQFDFYEPSKDSWKQISKRRKPIFKRHSYKKYLFRAAIFIGIFLGSYTLQYYLFSQGYLQTNTVQQIPQLQKAEAYYSMEFTNKLTEIRKHLASYPEIEKNMNYDISELDSIYQVLRLDLKDGVSQEDVIDAMVQNYKLKLQVLEDYLFYLQKNKTNGIKKQESGIYKL